MHLSLSEANLSILASVIGKGHKTIQVSCFFFVFISSTYIVLIYLNSLLILIAHDPPGRHMGGNLRLCALPSKTLVPSYSHALAQCLEKVFYNRSANLRLIFLVPDELFSLYLLEAPKSGFHAFLRASPQVYTELLPKFFIAFSQCDFIT